MLGSQWEAVARRAPLRARLADLRAMVHDKTKHAARVAGLPVRVGQYVTSPAVCAIVVGSRVATVHQFLPCEP